MWFLKNFLSISKYFQVVSGNTPITLRGIVRLIKNWAFIDINALVICGILFIGQCTKPTDDKVKCTKSIENGADNIFEFDVKKSISSGGNSPENGLYGEDKGQSTLWIDTGFKTNGENLIVFAIGDYFPWGKSITEKASGYQQVMTINQNGEVASGLQKMDDAYLECKLNTDITYSLYDNENVRMLYSNQLNKYTDINPNNRGLGKSVIIYNQNQQSDCIIGNNCDLGGRDDNNPIACVLKNGAGIYMKIGDVNYSYHIINHLIPKLKKKCITDDECTYEYEKSGDTILTQAIPFGLPMVVWQRDKVSSYIRDTQEQNKNFIPITSYDRQTDYEFTTLKLISTSNCNAGGYNDATKYETIDNKCYESVKQKMTPTQLANYQCPDLSNTDEAIKHPNELCKPLKGQKIYVAPADTYYDDDEGNIKLIFASGAVQENPKFSKTSSSGLQLSWIEYLAYKIISPLMGDQTQKENIDNLIESNRLTDSIEIASKNGEEIYISSYNGDILVKPTRFGLSGILLKTKEAGTDKYIKSTKTLLTPVAKNTKKNIYKIKPKDITQTPINNIELTKKTSGTQYLIEVDNLDKGLFVKARNAILTNSMFIMTKIMLVVWFFFSFGFGFLNKSKIIHLPVFTHDIKNLLILLWATDVDNYKIIDDILWPSLFKGAEAFSTMFFEAASGIYGLSVHSNSMYEFFDTAIQSMTSGETWHRVIAMGTNMQYFYIFLFWFPFFGTGIIKFIKSVAGSIFGLVITATSIGSTIMLFPLYALDSMFPKHDFRIKKILHQLIGDFIHYSIELGFYGLMMGFVYQAYLDAISIDICWKVLVKQKILSFLPEALFATWTFDGNYKDNLLVVSKMLMWAIIFALSSIISVKFAGLAKMAADLLWGKSSMSLGVGNGAKIGQKAVGVVDSITGGVANVTGAIEGKLYDSNKSATKLNKNNIKRNANNTPPHIGNKTNEIQNFKDEFNRINNNKSLSEKEKTQKLQELNKKMDECAKELRQERIAKYGKTETDEFHEQLEQIENDTTLSKEEREQKFQELDKKMDDYEKKQRQARIAKYGKTEIDEFEEQFEAIENDKSLSQEEKTQKMQELNKKMDERAKELRQERIAKYGKTETDELYEQLEQIENDTTLSKEEREQKLQELDKKMKAYSDQYETRDTAIENDNNFNNNDDTFYNESNPLLMQGSDLTMQGSDMLMHAGEDMLMKSDVVGVGGNNISQEDNINEELQSQQEQLQQQQSEKKFMDAKIEQNKALMAVMKDNKIKEKLEKDFADENISETELNEGLNEIQIHQSNLIASQDIFKKAKQKNAWSKKSKK